MIGAQSYALLDSGEVRVLLPHKSNKQKNRDNLMIKVTYRFNEAENKRIMEVRVFGLLVLRSTRQFIIFGRGEHMEW